MTKAKRKLERSLWRKTIREFRQKNDLQEKGAAAAMNVPYDTWRKWESMAMTPPKFVQIALTTLMQNYVKSPRGSTSS